MITLRPHAWSSLVRICWSLLSCLLVTAILASGPSVAVTWAQEEAPPPEAEAPPPPGAPAVPAPLSADELDQLVAPIALYPDALVAQILAGSTYPTEVVEAARWQAANPGLTGDSLAATVDSQAWDPSIKALTQFPSVLANMSNNLPWTSALGQAYYYQPEDVLNAVQVMRQRAYAAKTLVSTPQQTVADQDGVVTIAPVNPNEVYVPAYNPGTVYGAPVPVYPGYSLGEMIAAGVLAFGAGIAVGVLANEAWGWHGWNTDWHHHHVLYRNTVYVSNTSTFFTVGRGGGYGGRYFNPPAPNYGPGGFNAPAGGRPPQAGREGFRPNVPANPPAGAGRQMVSRGPGQSAMPGETRPETGGREVARPGAPANPPAGAGREIASRGPAERTLPAEARPGAGAREVSRPNAPAVRGVSKAPAAQSNPYRGFAKTPTTGLTKSAFARINSGGQALASSARGRASWGKQAAPTRAAPAARPAAARPAAPARSAAPAARSAPSSAHKR